MPELPDVVSFQSVLDATSLHKDIERVTVFNPRPLKGLSNWEMNDVCVGRSFERSVRHGKHLLAQLSHGPWLHFHFGMTGHLAYLQETQPDPDFTRVTFNFIEKTRLAYVSQRMLGEISLADNPERFIEEKKLGPDALNLGLDDFRKIVAARRGPIKKILMNQQVIAGLGNVYSDEVLFQARMSPVTRVEILDDHDIQNLHRAIQSVLKTAIGVNADPASMPVDYLIHRRQEGQPCPNGCAGVVAKKKVAARSAYFCPSCQG